MGILEKSSQGTKLFEFSKACFPTQVKPQLDLPKWWLQSLTQI